jgi:hypothetical protein
MANKTAAPWEIPYPEAADEIKIYPALSKELAERIALMLKEHIPIYKSYAGPATLKSGEWAQQTKAGETFTMPAIATVNQLISVSNGSEGEVKITTSGGALIFGDFINPGKATIVLAAGQHVILQSTGVTWYIMAGEPKRTQQYQTKTYTKAEAEAGVELSATRPSLVNLQNKGGVGAELIIEPSGQHAGINTAGNVTSVWVQPGEKWKSTQETSAWWILL